MHFQNPSNIQTKLEQKLSQALEQKGLRVVKENADMQILLNIVDFRKLMYAQRMSNYTYTFFYGPFMRVDADVEFENYFLMQVNLQVIQGVNSQSTSLVARTSYLAGVSESKEALEDKIVTQIISFFY
ncbi:hypothetical protein [Campylobacter sp. MIT 99-7217]|uniref:hypothetical protein n=1 Tax=Campylobacter sp. MIT 99-7217 TaxID=535091 RepID=UPI0021AE7CBE|nr:hypothetical protein [Campylobacter sp. MIT 99-7217]